MLRPELILIMATVMWGTSWVPLHAFADLGLSGMPMLLASYCLIAVVALPLVFSPRRQWLPGRIVPNPH
jgi:drug/metabolite transporter (DMT)-like permease